MACSGCGGACGGSCSSSLVQREGCGPSSGSFTSVSAVLSGDGLCGVSALGRSLIPTVDRLRDLYTQFGLRVYVVRLVKTLWSGGKRGRGLESVLQTIDLLPTPLLVDLASTNNILNPVGLEEAGSVGLREVSGCYSEDFLRGRDESGAPAPEDQSFYYEIEFPKPPTFAGSSAGPSDKRRFTLGRVLFYEAESFGWTVGLTRAHDDRARNGVPR